MTPQLLARAVAISSKDRHLGLLALVIAAGGRLDRADALRWYNGEPRRFAKVLADLKAHGCLDQSEATALVYQALRLPPLHPIPPELQRLFAFPDDLVDAACPLPLPTLAPRPGPGLAPMPRAGAPLPEIVSRSIRAESIDPNSISSRIDSRSISEEKTAAPPAAVNSARGYIEEKLCLPKLSRVRLEVTGGNRTMTAKFGWLLAHRPDDLAAIIGEAAGPGIHSPVQYVNAQMTGLAHNEIRA